AEDPPAVGHDALEQRRPVPGPDDHGGGLEDVGARVVGGVVEQAQVLDVDAGNGTDAADEPGDGGSVGQLDGQLVDGPAGAPFEDVDPDDLGLDGADGGGHLSQRSGSV